MANYGITAMLVVGLMCLTSSSFGAVYFFDMGKADSAVWSTLSLSSARAAGATSRR